MQSLEACWTSGGGDLTAGSVERTVLVFSLVEADLLRADRGGEQLAVLERVSTAGEQLCHRLEVPRYDVELFLGAFAVDSAGNRGAVSNIVRVLVPCPSNTRNTDNQVSLISSYSQSCLYVLQSKHINNYHSAGSVCLLKITEK